MKMHATGMGLEADMLFKPFCMCMKLFEKELSKQQIYDFGLRSGLAITRLCAKVLKTGASPADSLRSAMHGVLFSALTVEDAVMFQTIMNDYLPNTNIVQVNEDFSAKFAAAHPDASDFTKERAERIHEKSLIRHAIMVVGS